MDGRVVDSKDYQTKYFNLQFVEHNPNEAMYFPFKIRDLKYLLVHDKKLLFINPLTQQIGDLSVNQLLYSVLQKLFSINNPSHDDFYKFKFTCSIKLILLDFIVENSYDKSPLNQQRLSYVKKIQDALVPFAGDQADAIYTAVLKIMDDSACKEFYTTHLSALRSEVCTAMLKYKADKKEAIKQMHKKVEPTPEKAARGQQPK